MVHRALLNNTGQKTMPSSIFQTIKIAIVDSTGLAKDALHIYIGMGVFLLTSYLLLHCRPQYPKRWQFALIATLITALLGEAWDLYASLPVITHLTVWQASLHDLINTCLLPMLFFILLRYTKFF